MMPFGDRDYMGQCVIALRWGHMSVISSPIISNSIVCLIVYSCYYQIQQQWSGLVINPLWGESTGDWWPVEIIAMSCWHHRLCFTNHTACDMTDLVLVTSSRYHTDTVETLYNTINFCWSTHKRHSIARPKGRGMGCLLWVQRATYCVDLSILSSIKYLL